MACNGGKCLAWFTLGWANRVHYAACLACAATIELVRDAEAMALLRNDFPALWETFYGDEPKGDSN